MAKARESLVRAVVEASVANDWDGAVKEWSVTDMVESAENAGVCVCNQHGLHYLFTITNRRNDNELCPIGSTCIKLFGRTDLNRQVNDYIHHYEMNRRLYVLRRQMREDPMAIIRNGSGSAALIDELFERDAFPPSDYNDGDGGVDADFLLEMLRRRTRQPSGAQERKVWALAKYTVLPFLERTLPADLSASDSVGSVDGSHVTLEDSDDGPWTAPEDSTDEPSTVPDTAPIIPAATATKSPVVKPSSQPMPWDAPGAPVAMLF